MYELAHPWALALLPAPLLVWWLLPPYRERKRAVRIPFFAELVERLGRDPSHGAVVLRKNPLQIVLAPLLWALVVLAVAAPQRVEPPIERTESARDLLLAVEVIPDIFRTVGNVTADLAATRIVAGEDGAGEDAAPETDPAS